MAEQKPKKTGAGKTTAAQQIDPQVLKDERIEARTHLRVAYEICEDDFAKSQITNAALRLTVLIGDATNKEAQVCDPAWGSMAKSSAIGGGR